MSDLRVAVIGAGAVGLNVALNVQEKLPSCKLDIIADRFEDEVTSYGPAGLFRVGSSFRGPSEEITTKWISDSYGYYKSLLPYPECGMFEVSGYIFSDTSEEITKNYYLENVLPVYRSASEEEKIRESGSWKYGSYMTTLIMRCVKFLPWAQNKFRNQGGNIIKKKINNFAELSSDYDVVFNCSGLGAKYLCNDRTLLPIRGQLTTVEAPWIRNFYFNDYDTYIFPIGGGKVMLGGCRNFESYDVNVNKYDSGSIRERCETVVPSLRNVKTIHEWAGLRPYRPQVRVEVEYFGKVKIIHNYGHGSFGISMAPGTASYAVDLMRNSHTLSYGGKCRL